MNKDLEQFSEQRLKDMQKHVTAGMTLGHADALLIRQAIGIALAAKQAVPVAWEVKGILCHTKEEADVFIGEPEPLYDIPQPAHTEQDGWIKCTDDLPLIGVEVQVYIPGNAQTGRPTVTAMARFINRQGAPDYFWDKSTGRGGMTLDTSVTHWRPLAAAPKPESE